MSLEEKLSEIIAALEAPDITDACQFSIEPESSGWTLFIDINDSETRTQIESMSQRIVKIALWHFHDLSEVIISSQQDKIITYKVFSVDQMIAAQEIPEYSCVADIRRFLRNCKRFHARMLGEAYLSLMRGELTIFCPDPNLYKALGLRSGHLRTAAAPIDTINRVSIVTLTEPPFHFSVHTSTNSALVGITQDTFNGEILRYFVQHCIQVSPRCQVLQECEILQVTNKEDLETMLILDSPSPRIAEQLWQERKILVAKAVSLGLATRIKFTLLGSSYALASAAEYQLNYTPEVRIPVILPETLQLIETRAQRHSPLLSAIGSGAVTVTLHDANQETDFLYLDIHASLPERLNKPKKETIGQSLSFVDPRISEPRRHYIKRALANGQCEKYSYTYEDSHIWHFDVTVAPLYGSEEVITVVHDAASWQLGYWVNRRVKSE